MFIILLKDDKGSALRRNNCLWETDNLFSVSYICAVTDAAWVEKKVHDKMKKGVPYILVPIVEDRVVR